MWTDLYMSIKDKYYMTISHKMINDNIFIKPFVYHLADRGGTLRNGWGVSIGGKRKESKSCGLCVGQWSWRSHLSVRSGRQEDGECWAWRKAVDDE